MRGVEVHLTQCVKVGSCCLHEPYSTVDLGRQMLVPSKYRVCGEASVPFVDPPQVRVSTLGECANQVQGRG